MWELVSSAIVAAHERNAAAHGDTLLELERRFPTDPMAGVLVWYLLRRQVRVMVRSKNPSVEDIAPLVNIHYPAFSPLIRGSQDRLERTLLTVFDLLPHSERIGAGEAIVSGTAALGVMLLDPVPDLATARPQLAEWCIKYSGDLGDLGLR